LEKVTLEEDLEGGRNEIDWAIAWGTSEARVSARIAVCTTTIKEVSRSIHASSQQVFTVNSKRAMRFRFHTKTSINCRQDAISFTVSELAQPS
jgi:hypothetical protein